jgi:hypothetical protein
MGAPGFASRLTRGLLKNVADDAAARLSLFKVLNHEIRPSQLMTPSRALRATARALRDEPRHFASILGEFVSTAGQARRQARHARVRPPGMLQPAWQAR